jgi:hypothetical protein
MVDATKELLYTKGLFSALELILSPQASEINPMLCPVVGRGSNIHKTSLIKFEHKYW